MAGGQSLGCSVCKKRKIKCDEHEPVCLNCQKSGRECSGPATPSWTQLDGDASLVSFTPAKIRWSVPSNRRSHVTKPWNQQRHSPILAARALESSPPALVASPRLSEDQSLSSRLVYAIENTKGTGFTLELVGKHLVQLPARIGENKALDSAIACFLSAHTKLLCPAGMTEQYQHQLYSQALRDMKEAVESPREVDFEAVVAAMMVLGDFEIACGRVENVLDHARGAEAILKAWEPGSIRSAWALDLLEVMASSLIAVSLATGQECFLDKLEWTDVFDRAACQPLIPARELINFEYLKCCARLATIVRLLRNKTEEGISPETAKLIDQEWRRVSQMSEEVKNLMGDCTFVIEVSSEDNDIPFETYYRFSDVQLCETLCNVWKLFILVSALVQHYFPDDITSKHRRDQAQAAINICKCFEFVRPLKPVGAFFMHLSLPRAAVALPDPYRQWALSAYKEILDSGLAIGFDIAAPTKLLARWMSGWNGSSYQKWWLGGDDQWE
ncbi:uncharacterized protein A1O5_05119 [Cladophialophora psammophila CBS 110553]|uniref:Zn(2)-C6 fungal-type domain-containing protein n=1 Tax=Cladophialophora psammophila CBS 110553 TaxID=1182543 RepID=W9WTP5_9EURO|nr:uncharacterized protein A1O5_05119 [Cladophialophora psammophila CBS 110553]EXJ71313.1 hypothetical protein A1O5_05119 [Cladophialophora psammophila CBS 110553]